MNDTYKVVHTIKLVTEFNLMHPSARIVTALTDEQAQELCRKAFIGMATDQGWLKEANENGGTWAYVRFAEDGE
jgi:hypothetical protein